MEPEVKEKFNWKRLFITIAIVIFTSAVVGGVVWYMMDLEAREQKNLYETQVQSLQNQIDELKKETQEEKDDLFGWKTYENEKYGLIFKYPSDFLLESIDYQDCEDLKKNDIDCEIMKDGKGINLSIVKNDQDKTQYIMVDTEKFSNLETWLKRLESSMGKQGYEGIEIEPKITAKESIKIGGLGGYKITVEGRPYTDQIYAFYYDGYVYTFSNPLGSMGDNAKNIDEFREILANVVGSISLINN